MISMKRKTLITIGTISALTIAFTVSVSVASSLRDVKSSFVVYVGNIWSNSDRYIVTRQDARNGIVNADENIWEYVRSDKADIVIAKELGIDKDRIVSSVSSDDTGLERFIRGLLNTKSHNSDSLTIAFNLQKGASGEKREFAEVKIKDGLNADVVVTKSLYDSWTITEQSVFINENKDLLVVLSPTQGQQELVWNDNEDKLLTRVKKTSFILDNETFLSKSKNERYNLIWNACEHIHATNEPTHVLDELISILLQIKMYDKTTNTVRTTTHQDIKDALTRFK